MKNALFKDTIREIKKTFGRFISIFGIVLVGVAFFVGVHHVDKDVLSVNDGLAVFQRVQRVAVQPVDGRIQVGMVALVLHNVIKRIYDHF